MTTIPHGKKFHSISDEHGKTEVYFRPGALMHDIETHIRDLLPRHWRVTHVMEPAQVKTAAGKIRYWMRIRSFKAPTATA